MPVKTSGSKEVEAYIAGFPAEVQAILEKIRQTILKAAPGAEEKISYRMPSFWMHGRVLIYMGGHRDHIGLYPAPRDAAEFKKELAAYKGGKGTVQFPLAQKIPYDLIRRIVRFKAKENPAKAKGKAAKG
jgi:uncharacterized protein YdhG (YjbR/CyaY superfamily)